MMILKYKREITQPGQKALRNQMNMKQLTQIPSKMYFYSLLQALQGDQQILKKLRRERFNEIQIFNMDKNKI